MPPLTAIRFAMLAVLAGLLVALALGVAVPKLAIVLLIVAQAGLRFFVSRNDPKLRNSSLFQMLISLLFGYLILSS